LDGKIEINDSTISIVISILTKNYPNIQQVLLVAQK